MQKERTARYTINEVIMETFLWIIFALIVSKALLKALRPDINRIVDKNIKKTGKGIKAYYKYCKQFW
jgi:hypothetical protein